MEKYIFDGRTDFETSPKYLKRNQPLEIKHNSFHQTHPHCLNSKVFVTFDYSYYHNILPKTSQMKRENRVYNLENLLGWQARETSQKRKTENKLFLQQKMKWKKGQSYARDQQRRKYHFEPKNNKKKIKTPDKPHPSVGDYNIQTQPHKKKIIYDIKIRGKPSSQSKSLHRFGKVNSFEGKSKKMLKNQNIHPDIGKKMHEKGFTMENKVKKLDEQNDKLMDSVQVKNVWNRLMRKHKLKGSKFDNYPSLE